MTVRSFHTTQKNWESFLRKKSVDVMNKPVVIMNNIQDSIVILEETSKVIGGDNTYPSKRRKHMLFCINLRDLKLS